jgi:hypothetical protein
MFDNRGSPNHKIGNNAALKYDLRMDLSCEDVAFTFRGALICGLFHFTRLRLYLRAAQRAEIEIGDVADNLRVRIPGPVR